MTKIKAICLAIVLVLTLGVSALAGDISTPGSVLADPIAGDKSTVPASMSPETSAFWFDPNLAAFSDTLLRMVSLF